MSRVGFRSTAPTWRYTSGNPHKGVVISSWRVEDLNWVLYRDNFKFMVWYSYGDWRRRRSYWYISCGQLLGCNLKILTFDLRSSTIICILLYEVLFLYHESHSFVSHLVFLRLQNSPYLQGDCKRMRESEHTNLLYEWIWYKFPNICNTCTCWHLDVHR
jgi:hypothetical protein